MKAGLFIPDILHGKPGEMGDVVAGDLRWSAGLSCDDYPIGRRQRFTRPDVARVPASAVRPSKNASTTIRDAIANLCQDDPRKPILLVNR
jgi:hypothetical protein